jgi:aminopeptidase N
LGNPWIATANQGLGASVWWPNKDHQTAEPDSMSINITVPNPIVNVSNGRLRDTTRHDNSMTTWHWFISNPINNYNIAVNAGNYVNFTDTFEEKNGTLDLSYWVLEQNLDKAKEQFRQVKPMMRCFEEWFGPYPFYEDSFKLVETPHLGMEHQSAVAYGNQYQNGYMGKDLSGSGWGLKWDFIIIHEAAHEWWGNNITTNDIADMWVHEGFTSYSESIYTECRFGKEAAREYTIGLRANIENREPVTGQYGLNNEGSGDMYYKGHNMLHTIRQIVGNDSTWKKILRGINRDFRHQIVTADQVEQYIIEQSGKDLDDLFDQYLHYANIPVFQYYIDDIDRLHYRWKADVPHFNMPLKIAEGEENYYFIYPVSDRWKTTNLKEGKNFRTDPNFYINTERISSKKLIKENN